MQICYDDFDDAFTLGSLTFASLSYWKAPAGAGRAITRRGTRNSSCFKSANYPGNNLQTHLRFDYIMLWCSKKAKKSVRLCSLVHSCHRTFRNSNDSLQCLNWPNCVLSDACNTWSWNILAIVTGCYLAASYIWYAPSRAWLKSCASCAVWGKSATTQPCLQLIAVSWEALTKISLSPKFIQIPSSTFWSRSGTQNGSHTLWILEVH